MIKNIIKNSFPQIFCFIKKIRAFYWSRMSLEYILKKKWYKEFNSDLNLETPKTYNEKLQWLKLNSKNNNLANQYVDKLTSRDLIEKKIGSKYLNKLIGTYNSFDEINFKQLPNDYVLKATHDSGSVLIVKNNKIDLQTIDKIKCNLDVNYADYSQEWVYDNIKPKIIIEKFLKSDDGKDLKDYKVFCFHGEAKLIQIDVDRFEEHKRDFYDLNWNKLDLEIKFSSSNQVCEKPDLLEEMIELSNILSSEFKHVRVDWYISNEKLIFGELTFFHGGGYEKFNSKEWENKMGDWIIL